MATDINKEILVDMVADKTGMAKKDIEIVVDNIVDVIMDALHDGSQGDDCEFRNFQSDSSRGARRHQSANQAADHDPGGEHAQVHGGQASQRNGAIAGSQERRKLLKCNKNLFQKYFSPAPFLQGAVANVVGVSYTGSTRALGAR